MAVASCFCFFTIKIFLALFYNVTFNVKMEFLKTVTSYPIVFTEISIKQKFNQAESETGF